MILISAVMVTDPDASLTSNITFRMTRVVASSPERQRFELITTVPLSSFLSFFCRPHHSSIRTLV